jgi:capsular exopolysaccharide synthesis family protein
MSRIHQALRRAEQTVTAPSTSTDDGFQTSLERVRPDVPPDPRGGTGLSARALTAPTLILHDAVSPTVLEQYRRLGAVVHHAQAARGVKALMIVSAVADEGKTLTSANVALTLSESYHRRVLLIDGDLRRPTLHDLFGVTNTTGWRETLNGTVDQAQHWRRLTATLSLLTAGDHDGDPIQALTAGRLASALHRAAAEFDWVIIDTPPAAILPDANLMARHVDAAVLVVRAGSTAVPAIQRAIEAVGRERILGVALNRVEDRILADNYYTRYYGNGIERQRA